jgi:predicted dehydrogenase
LSYYLIDPNILGETSMEMVWLIGAGYMAKEYAKVLKALGHKFIVVGRGRESAVDFEQALKIPVVTGGIEEYIRSSKIVPEHAIVTVDAQYLYDATRKLLDCGVRNLLVEKPGALVTNDVEKLEKVAEQRKSNVYIAYNRRFYSSVLKAEEMIREDGGCLSFIFEFTEWSHIVKDLKKSEAEKRRWFVANSTHVVDLAFYLGGKPKEIRCFTSGGLEWHPSASIFAGAGTADTGALFSYHANWAAPGRWSVELMTAKHRLILRPLEELQIQKPGSMSFEKVELDDRLDKQYKPGLFKQTESFLTHNYGGLKPLQEQVKDLKLYYKMAGY